ncbi:unnamed protein product, partial [Urochloa humidicola]
HPVTTIFPTLPPILSLPSPPSALNGCRDYDRHGLGLKWRLAGARAGLRASSPASTGWHTSGRHPRRVETKARQWRPAGARAVEHAASPAGARVGGRATSQASARRLGSTGAPPADAWAGDWCSASTPSCSAGASAPADASRQRLGRRGWRQEPRPGGAPVPGISVEPPNSASERQWSVLQGSAGARMTVAR